MKVSE